MMGANHIANICLSFSSLEMVICSGDADTIKIAMTETKKITLTTTVTDVKFDDPLQEATAAGG